MIKREIIIFLVVGSLTVIVDYITYIGLISVINMEVDRAKAIGFLAGTLFAYFANRFWTFGQTSYKQGSARRFSALYTATLSANVLINALAIKLLADVVVSNQIAFLLATVVSASINFLGMKYFVFKPITAKYL